MTISPGYADQVDQVLAELRRLASVSIYEGAPEHNGTCAFFAIVAMEENLDMDGIAYTDEQITDLAVRAITEDDHCHCDED